MIAESSSSREGLDLAKQHMPDVILIDALLSTSEGEDAAIGHLYMLSRTFRQMLVILEKNVRDSRTIWQALWQGFRVPPFAAEDLIRQAKAKVTAVSARYR